MPLPADQDFASGLNVAEGKPVTAQRFSMLHFPPHIGSQLAASRFAAAAALDTAFASHQTLVFLHIIPAFLFMSLIPFQFVETFRRCHLAWHRWTGRILMVLGTVIGFSALVMSFRLNIGGVSETAATTFYAILFLVFLALGFWNIRRASIVSHRQWMILAFAVALGVATTRPIIGAFFAAGRLSPHDFLGAASGFGNRVTLGAYVAS